MAEKKKSGVIKDTVAESVKPAKRRLKAKPTLREQVEQTNTKTTGKSAKSNSIIVRLLTPVGRLFAAIWRSKLLAPLRFVLRTLSRFLIPRYFKDSYQELKKVSWPSAKVTWKLTGAVLLFGLIFGLVIAGLDYVFEKVFREVLLG